MVSSDSGLQTSRTVAASTVEGGGSESASPLQRTRRFELDVRVVFSNFIDDLVPHDHAVPLGIRLGDVCEHFTRAGARQLEGELGDAPHSDSGENGDLYREGQST
jgi:hypothetical protein